MRDNLTFRAPSVKVDELLVNHLVERLGLRSCLGHDALDFLLNEGGTNLSGGQQQRLALLRALQLNSPVLILDEATSALDEKSRDVVFELLREKSIKGHNVILITHDNSLASRCDMILNLVES